MAEREGARSAAQGSLPERAAFSLFPGLLLRGEHVLRDVPHGHGEQLLAGVAEKEGRLRVAVHEAAPLVVDEEGVDGLLEELSEAMLALPERPLGPLSLREVGERPERTDDLAGYVPVGGRAYLGPERLPVPALEAHLVALRRPFDPSLVTLQ